MQYHVLTQWKAGFNWGAAKPYPDFIKTSMEVAYQTAAVPPLIRERGEVVPGA